MAKRKIKKIMRAKKSRIKGHSRKASNKSKKSKIKKIIKALSSRKRKKKRR